MYIESATSPNGNGGKSRIAAYVAARSLWDDTVSADEHLADWCRVAFGPARDAETPMLFTQIRQPATSYLAIPEVSSERRKFLTPNVIASSKLYIAIFVYFYCKRPS